MKLLYVRLTIVVALCLSNFSQNNAMLNVEGKFRFTKEGGSFFALEPDDLLASAKKNDGSDDSAALVDSMLQDFFSAQNNPTVEDFIFIAKKAGSLFEIFKLKIKSN